MPHVLAITALFMKGSVLFWCTSVDQNDVTGLNNTACIYKVENVFLCVKRLNFS